MTVILTQNEIELLDRQPTGTSQDGGFQALLERLRNNVNRTTGELDLSSTDLERIPRYAFDYGQGGWEDRLIEIFGRVLGPRLGR